VALLVLAYDRYSSAWAITLVLLADFLPAMALGPLFGAAADRWSRRWCAVVSDLARAVAFLGIGLVDGFEATVALALLAGAGAGLFTPAVMAGLPSLVGQKRLPAATSLFGAITDLGHIVGPALAGVLLLVASAETVMFLNAASFLVSALLVAVLPFGDVAHAEETAEGRRSLLAEAREGVRATARMVGVRVVILASAAVLLCAGMLNVGELLLATEELDVSEAAFSLLVAIYGLGFLVGSLSGARGGTIADYKRRFLLGLLALAVGLIAAGVAPAYWVALATFALMGLGNGLVLVHDRLLLQTAVSDALMGRVFGIKDGLHSWAFGVAFVSAGGIIALVGTRELFVIAGVASLAVFAVTWRALQRPWEAEALAEAATATVEGGPPEPLARAVR
jgi:MFS family permease